MSLTPPTIPEEEKSPAVIKLLDFIEQQNQLIQQLLEQIQTLKDEINKPKTNLPDLKFDPAIWKIIEKRKNQSNSKEPDLKKDAKPLN